MSLFDRNSAAGAITSRVDHQDAAAVLVSLRLLAGESMFGMTVEEPSGVVIHCEGRDDLEVVGPETRCLISVKAQSGDLRLVVREYERLSGKSCVDTSRERTYALLMIGPQPSEIAIFAQQLSEVKSLLAHRAGAERNEVHSGFHRRWPQAGEALVNSFYVIAGSPPLHSDEYMAVAVQLLRRIAPLTNYTDDRSIVLVSDLTRR